MEQINPYAVMRNTATLKAYRAYNREAAKAGQAFFVAVVIFNPAFWLPIESLVERRFVHGKAADLPLLAALVFAPAVLSLLFLVIGVLKMRRFRREHPIPDEWRQIPRTTWPFVPRETRRRRYPAA